MFAVNTPASNLKYMASAMFPSLLLDKKDRSKILPFGEKLIFLLKETGYLHIQGKFISFSTQFFLDNICIKVNIILSSIPALVGALGASIFGRNCLVLPTGFYCLILILDNKLHGQWSHP
jgi:hypothetical protein